MKFVFPNQQGDFVDIRSLCPKLDTEFVESLDAGAICFLPSCNDDDLIEPLSFLVFCRVWNMAFCDRSLENLFVWGADESSWIFQRRSSLIHRLHHTDGELIRESSEREFFSGAAVSLCGDAASELIRDSVKQELDWNIFNEQFCEGLRDLRSVLMETGILVDERNDMHNIHLTAIFNASSCQKTPTPSCQNDQTTPGGM